MDGAMRWKGCRCLFVKGVSSKPSSLAVQHSAVSRATANGYGGAAAFFFCSLLLCVFYTLKPERPSAPADLYPKIKN